MLSQNKNLIRSINLEEIMQEMRPQQMMNMIKERVKSLWWSLGKTAGKKDQIQSLRVLNNKLKALNRMMSRVRRLKETKNQTRIGIQAPKIK